MQMLLASILLLYQYDLSKSEIMVCEALTHEVELWALMLLKRAEKGVTSDLDDTASCMHCVVAAERREADLIDDPGACSMSQPPLEVADIAAVGATADVAH